MARALRMEFPGALHYVTAQGNARGAICLDDGDRRHFLALLTEVVRTHGWTCHAWCLLDDHYHLMIETAEPNLGRGMRQLNGVYTQRFNRGHERTGHVFQGRYKAVLVERGPYWLELARHVVLNPVRAGLVAVAGEWQWSSYRATADIEPRPRDAFDASWSDPTWPDWILRQLGGEDRLARAAYRRYVDAGATASPEFVKREFRGPVLGSEAFIEKLKTRYADQDAGSRLFGQGRARPSMEALRDRHRERGAWMTVAHDRHGYTLAEIGSTAGLHYSSISKIISTWRRRNPGVAP
jgi:putative transposase